MLHPKMTGCQRLISVGLGSGALDEQVLMGHMHRLLIILILLHALHFLMAKSHGWSDLVKVRRILTPKEKTCHIYPAVCTGDAKHFFYTRWNWEIQV